MSEITKEDFYKGMAIAGVLSSPRTLSPDQVVDIAEKVAAIAKNTPEERAQIRVEEIGRAHV